MRLVIDACLPPWLADVFAAVIGPACIFDHVARLYGHGSKDADWIARLTEEGGGVFLTYDRHMRRRPLEVQALIASHCVGIVLPAQWQEDEDHALAARLLWDWPHLRAAADLTPPQMLELPWAAKPRLPGRWRGWDKIASSVTLQGQAGKPRR
ncbi:MAG TPA: hypothetical protein VGM87_02265 [Roseomonas sp.]